MKKPTAAKKTASKTVTATTLNAVKGGTLTVATTWWGANYFSSSSGSDPSRDK